MHARSRTECDFRADADADRLDGVNAHHRLRQPAIELPVPLHVGAEPRRQTRGDDFEGAAERVSGLFGGVDGRNHALLQFGVGAAQGIIGQPEGLVERDDAAVGKGDTADGGDVARDTNTEASEQQAGQRASGDAGRGLSGAGALEDVADIAVPVLDRTGQVRMSRPRPRDGRTVLGAGRAFRLLRLDVHRLLPVHPVAVANQQGDRRARGDAMADARKDLGAIALDLHPPAPAVAALTTTKLQVEGIDIELQARGHTVNGDDQRLPVRLASGEKSQHSLVILYEHPASGPRTRTFQKAPRSRSPRSEETAHFASAASRFTERFSSVVPVALPVA